MSLHRCFIERRSRLGWRAECSCGFKGKKRWHPLLAEREADRYLGESRVLAAALPSLTDSIRGPMEAELKEAKDSLAWAMEYIDEPEPTEQPGNHAKFHAAMKLIGDDDA